MSIKMGPILGFTGSDENTWRVCAITVIDVSQSNPVVKLVGKNDVLGQKLETFNGFSVWLHEWSTDRSDKDQEVEYRLLDSRRNYVVPGKTTPLRSAYASCNGFSSLSAMKKIIEKNERWKDLLSKHQKEAFHLLLMGGDQVYADSIWETVPSIKMWADLSKSKRLAAPFTSQLDKEVREFYFNLYCERWNAPDMRDAFAQIPTLMMWDDHDIFDGWGSYDKKTQNCPVFKGIFAHAKHYFRLFQLKCKEVPAGYLGTDGFSYIHQIGDVAFAAPDLRSERTEEQVMSSNTWDTFLARLDQLQGCKHLFVLSSIPVVYPGFGVLEGILGIVPGQQELEDDLKDHWTSRTHRGERLRLIHRLLTLSDTKKCRVTILSGDVHVAALGILESTRAGTNPTVITQLIASGIVHPAPPALALYFLKTIAGNVEQVDRGIKAEMAEFPGNNFKFIGTRNWLSLKLDDKDRVWAEWFAEGEKAPYTKVIHPL